MIGKKAFPYAMITPSMIVFCLFFIYPIGYMIYLSLHDWNFVSPVKDFVGLSNFTSLFSEQEFLEVMRNSLVYTVLTVTLTTGTSLGLAVWLNKQGIVYRFVQGAMFSPHIISLVSISMLWMWLMDPDYGLLNWFLGLFGLPESPWLTDPSTSLLSLVLVAVWKGIGFNALVFIAGLQSIPRDMYEAASLDDATWFRTFWKITLPMLSPTLFFLIIINVISSFQVFETIAIMTQGGPINSTNTLVFYIYEYGFNFFKIGYASAAGVLLLIVVSVMTFFYFRLLSVKVHYR
ncbi:sn-glycerol 3-phosphate transport system permease protein [Salibacterium salarium]|uniref:carbohydrate ABC transporter permease n=1 Tax=Salibacterium salarium TaxID=284579 RepID=UPI002785FA61|nr:sugar ABC transporter permease [Salibacterium salarium]MDQ0297703.1 sn-glycerol 3-phosphate transport system permease protein [Salibacterium salarium]